MVAVGETGLDRHWDYTPFPQQEDYFARHLEMRESIVWRWSSTAGRQKRTWYACSARITNAMARCGAVMHSFTGDAATATACLEMGLFLSFAGMVTYKNAQALRDVAKAVPLDRLLVETDSPYLCAGPGARPAQRAGVCGAYRRLPGGAARHRN